MKQKEDINECHDKNDANSEENLDSIKAEVNALKDVRRKIHEVLGVLDKDTKDNRPQGPDRIYSVGSDNDDINLGSINFGPETKEKRQ
eukprot:2280610-Heterocapsa_arctica.AAC.1